MMAPGSDDIASALWRMESPKLIAVLVRMLRDVDLAEELAQDTFVAALTEWAAAGPPPNPGAWLMTAARHQALDVLRHQRRAERKQEQLQHELQVASEANFDELPDDIIRDDLLRLVFIACDPVLSPEARAALTLRLLGGLTTHEIARAFLTPEPTIAQRITRSKRMLAERGVAFQAPRAVDLRVRLESVLEVIYLIFNEGYLATSGDDWLRPALCLDALRLSRILVELVPEQAEAHGLLALMSLQASRARARTTAEGEAVLLPDQDRRQWDPLLIGHGLSALARSDTLAPERPGSYQLQAAIAACHARAAHAADTDWPRIAGLYELLARVAPSPIVELNRAVALGMAFGPDAALSHLEPLTRDPALAQYPFLPSVRADFLAKLGRHDEARAEVERAAELTSNQRERELLLARAAAYARAQTAS